jgi:hypothetical protein
MLADHVATDPAGILDVEQHGLFAGRGIQPVWKIALVKGTIQEKGFLSRQDIYIIEPI